MKRTTKAERSAAMRALAFKRAAALTPKRRTQIAKKAANTRWRKARAAAWLASRGVV